MYHGAFYTKLSQGIIGREARKPRLVGCMVATVRIMLVQMFKELFGRSLLSMSAHKPRGGEHRDTPCSQMDVDTNRDILSAEIFFVTLYHRRIGFAVNVFCFYKFTCNCPYVYLFSSLLSGESLSGKGADSPR